MSLERAYELAGRQIGLNETDQKRALQRYLSDGGQNLDPATRAWCADFVNATLSQSGMRGTGSGMARSFMGWGTGVSDPRRGDLAVFSRGDPSGPYGHVGFFEGYDENGNIIVLGGNQNDEVSRRVYESERLLGFRRYDSSSGTPGGDKASAQGALTQTPTAGGIIPQGREPSMEDYERGIAALFGEKRISAPRAPQPPSGRYGASSRMSPLSGGGIPGLGNIKKYSTPGGIESLYKKP